MDKRLSADLELFSQTRTIAATAADAFQRVSTADEAARLAGAGNLAIASPAAAAAGAAGPQFVPPVGGDDVPDDTSSTVTIGVQEGQTIESALDHPGDNDYFQVNLSAGETYEFTVVPGDTDATTGPDLLIEIYDSEGNLLVTQDGPGAGSTEEVDFTAAADGTYYVNVAGYLDAAVGAYSITGKIDNDAPQPNDGTPLAAIDWGTRVDTDGKTTDSGDEIIQVYFAKLGEVYQNSIPPVVVAEGWSDWEKADAFTSFQQYENIINVKFKEVDQAKNADFVFTTSSGPPVLLGAMNPPGESYEGQAWFNNKGVGWDEGGLQQGGYGFITFTHELGHGMGMAHPHDNGGSSEVMHGVESDTDSGDFGLNQGVFTVMTYNDGWPDGPNGKSESNDFGWSGTLMAMDIAVLQQKYGANTNFHTGNDTYTLWDENAPGTMYACIWDTGGRDTIAAGDAMNVSIDLREATLKYEIGGGGYVSFAEGIIGGYTVANGVVIEDAKGGAGIDLLRGNDVANQLTGLAGADILRGANGADVLLGGDGVDELFGSRGADVLEGGAGRDLLHGGAGADRYVFDADAIGAGKVVDRIFDYEAGESIDLRGIDANTTRDGNQAFTLVDHLSGHAGELMVFHNEAGTKTYLFLDDDGDRKADLKIVLDGMHTDLSGLVL